MANPDRFTIGIKYTTNIELTQLVPKDEQDKPAVNEQVFLDKITLSYIDSGDMSVVQENVRTGAETVRKIKSDYGTELGQIPLGTTLGTNRVYTETGHRQVFPRGRAEDSKVDINSNSHLNIRIAAVSQEGTLIPQQ